MQIYDSSYKEPKKLSHISNHGHCHTIHYNLTIKAPCIKVPIWLIISAHLECESKTRQNVWTGICKRAELGLLFQALVGTFPSITTVLTDRAFRSMPNSQSSPNKRDLVSLHTSQSLHIFSITHIMSTNSDSLKQTKMASFTNSCECSSPQLLIRIVYCKGSRNIAPLYLPAGLQNMGSYIQSQRFIFKSVPVRWDPFVETLLPCNSLFLYTFFFSDKGSSFKFVNKMFKF